MQEEDSTITATSVFFLLVNLILFVIAHTLDWSFPVPLFHHSRAPGQIEDDTGGDLGEVYEDDYENPFMSRDFCDVAPAQIKHNWFEKKLRKLEGFVPGDNLFSKGVTKGLAGAGKLIGEVTK